MADKLTDKETIKALECCDYTTSCPEDCPLKFLNKHGVLKCHRVLKKSLIDIYNRQQAELEDARIGVKSYKGKYESAVETAKELQTLVEEQQAELNNYSHNIKNLTASNMRLHAEIERLKYNCGCRLKSVKATKSEAIKEFAERLKEKAFYCERKDSFDNFMILETDVDNLVKEMVGEDK